MSAPPPARRCTACGALHYPPRRHCGACGAWDRMEPAPLPDRGTLFSWTTIHVAPARAGLPLPYAVGYVDLDDGPRVLAPIDVGGADPDAVLALGDRLRLVPGAGGDDVPFRFAPVGHA